MKKIIAAAAVAACFSASSAFAVDSTGCGLGSMAWRGQSGVAPQVLAATTNGFFGIQTFGITSGTSGCDPRGRITGGTGVMFAFLEKNLDQFALDASRGKGETIDAIASLMNLPAEQVDKTAQENFAVLFPRQNVDALSVSETFASLLNG